MQTLIRTAGKPDASWTYYLNEATENRTTHNAKKAFLISKKTVRGCNFLTVSFLCSCAYMASETGSFRIIFLLERFFSFQNIRKMFELLPVATKVSDGSRSYLHSVS